MQDYFNRYETEEIEAEADRLSPVCLDVGIPSRVDDQISFISLRIAEFLIYVCNLLIQLLLGLSRTVILGSYSQP
jgi:hypothetical protein